VKLKRLVSATILVFPLLSCSTSPTQQEREQEMIRRSFMTGENRITISVGDPNTKIISWLVKADKRAENIKTIGENKELYESTGYSIECKKIFGCPVSRLGGFERPPVTSAPITPEFEHYLNDLHSQLNDDYEKLAKEVARLAAKDKLLKAQAEETKKRQEAAEAEERYRERKNYVSREISKIDEIAKRSGYEGYLNLTVFDFIRQTQRAGSLENYLGYTIGCALYDLDFCEDWYPEIKIIQVLEAGSLYAFSGYVNGELIEFTVYIENEKNKIYQDGQQLINDHLVFKGVFTYTAVLGNRKSVPHFGRVAYTIQD